MPDAIRKAGLRVELMDDHFDHKSQDDYWIPRVAANGWIIVTKDKRILYKPPERAAIERSGAHYVSVVAKDRSGPQIAAAVGKWIARVDETIHAAGSPSWFRIRMTEAQLLLGGEWRPLRAMHTNPKRWRRGVFK